MKTLIILMALITAAAAAYADSDETNQGEFQPETLFGSHGVAIGAYGGPVGGAAYLGGKFYPMAGGEGGVIIDHWLIIGGAGRGLVQPVISPSGNEIEYGWGGLMLGFIILPEDLIHPYVKAIVGGGSVNEYAGNMYNGNSYNTNFIQSQGFFSLDGEVGVQMNVCKWLRIDVYGGYHYIYGPLAFDGMTDDNFRNFDVGIKFDFGWF